jgi:hypothetical protein
LFESIYGRGILIVLHRWADLAKTSNLRSWPIALALFALWLCVEVMLIRQHAVWRDEVRALSLATQGDLMSMVTSLRGEGHPALWYLFLRGGYFLLGSSAALWIVSLGIASCAAMLLLLWAPFGWPLIVLLLFGRVVLFEYSVMARNYGIGMLLMFLFAACYRRYRDRTVILGILLFLLANTNVLSALLVGAFLLFWSIDVVIRQGLQWGTPLKAFLLNATIAVAGVIVCFVTVYPPSADAVPISFQHGIDLRRLALVTFEPALSFKGISGARYWEMLGLNQIGNIVMSFALIGSTLGLLRSPGAFIAALASLLGFSLFFTLVYPGSYRHEALWLIFLISMYWIARERELSLDRPYSVSQPIIWTSMLGSALILLLVTAQFMGGLRAIADTYGGIPQSRSRDFSQLVKGRPDLKDAVIIADPDYLLEPLSYYIGNPLYFMREHKFSRVTNYTNKALLSLDLDDVLNVAKMINRERGKPVVILLSQRLDPAQPAMTYQEGYNWSLSLSSDQVRRFLANTQLLAHFAPARSDESFDVYLLNQQ